MRLNRKGILMLMCLAFFSCSERGNFLNGELAGNDLLIIEEEIASKPSDIVEDDKDKDYRETIVEEASHFTKEVTTEYTENLNTNRGNIVEGTITEKEKQVVIEQAIETITEEHAEVQIEVETIFEQAAIK